MQSQLYRQFIVPVAFHNLRGYDSHFIFKANLTNIKIKVIANSMEKYLSFDLIMDKIKYRFIDTMQFMPSSLESLVEIMKKSGVKFVNFHEQFKDYSDELKNLLLQKGVYPYSYIESKEKLSETVFPPIEAFYNDLEKKPCSKEDYDRGSKVFQLACKTLKDYHDLYLKTDVILLADVFENFRDTSINELNLDPCWFYGAPGLSWNAMLQGIKKIDGEWIFTNKPPKDAKKIEPLEIDGFNDKQMNMLLMVEDGKRGGICQASYRYHEANNKYVGYDPSKPSSFIWSIDANGLYGGAMRYKLPISNYMFGNPDKMTPEHIMEMTPDDEWGCFLTVKLKIPHELHDYFNDYPVAPINREGKLSKAMLERKKIIEGRERNAKGPKKLILDLEDKDYYTLHYLNLKLYLQLGCVLEKVYKVLWFRQEALLKPYIDFNDAKRTAAINDFHKDFFKLMINIIFGKTCENVRNHRNIKLVNDPKRFAKIASNPLVQTMKIIQEQKEDYNGLVAVERKKKKIVYNKPVAIGVAILDISKTIMYNHHYNVMKKNISRR